MQHKNNLADASQPWARDIVKQLAELNKKVESTGAITKSATSFIEGTHEQVIRTADRITTIEVHGNDVDRILEEANRELIELNEVILPAMRQEIEDAVEIVDDLNDNVLPGIVSDLETVQGDLVDVNDELDSIEGTLAGVQGDLVDVNAELDVMEQAIEDVQGDLVDVNSELGNMEQAILDVQGDLVDVQDVVDLANQNAQDALDAATAAETTASGANARMSGTGANGPATRTNGAALIQGDEYVRVNSTGQAIGVQVWNGSAWVAQQMLADSVLVPGSAGSTVIADGAITTDKIVANAITGDKVAANSITASRLVVGDGDNFIVDPYLIREDLLDYRIAESSGSWTPLTSSQIPGATYVYAPPSSNAQSFRLVTPEVDGSYSYPPVVAGRKYNIRFRVNGGSTGSPGVGVDDIRVAVRERKADGSTTYLAVGDWMKVPSSEFTWVDYQWEVPSDTVGAQFDLQVRAGNVGNVSFATPIVTAMTGTTLIEDGAISTDKITANAITGDKVAANTLTADKLIVGNGENMIPWNPSSGVEPHTSSGIATVPLESYEDDRDGWVLRQRASTAGTDGVFAAFALLRSGYMTQYGRTGDWDVEEGVTYSIKVGVSRRGGGPPAGTANFRIRAIWVNHDNTNGEAFNSESVPVVFSALDGTNTSYATLTMTAPSGAAGIRIYLQKSFWSVGDIYLRSASMRKAVGTTLIEDGAISTDKITANAITGDKVAANTLTASKLLIGESGNLFPNTWGERQSSDGFVSQLAWATSSGWAPPGLQGSLRTSPGQGTINPIFIDNPVIPVTEGDSYVFEFWLRTASGDAAGSRIYIELRDQNGDHVPSSTLSGNPGGGSYLFQNSVVPNVWTKYTIVFTPNAQITSVRTSGWYFNHPNGTNRNATIGFAFRMMRRTGTTLIEDGAITTDKIIANAVNADKIATNAVVADKIAANAVTTAKIDALAVNAGKIAANAVTTAKINALAVNADKIAANAVTADKIVANAITAGKIATNAVTADNIAANAIDAKHTITGALIRSSTGVNRTQMNNSGIQVFSNNVEQVRIGYGIATGMSVRNPSNNVLTPLGPMIFGATAMSYTTVISLTKSGSSNAWGPWTYTNAYQHGIVAPSGRLLIFADLAQPSDYLSAYAVQARVGLTTSTATGPGDPGGIVWPPAGQFVSAGGDTDGGSSWNLTPSPGFFIISGLSTTATYNVRFAMRGVWWESGSYTIRSTGRKFVAMPI